MSSPAPIEIHSGIVLKGELSMDQDVILTGRFEGDLRTLGRLTVSPGGAAIGTIEAGALVLEPGNLVEARIKIVHSGGAKAPAPAPKKTNGKWPFGLEKLFSLGRT
jgi:cytoskeletal protein CcmA (bactofilin family)